MPGGSASAELDDLLGRAWHAPGLDRISFRDRIAPFGDAAIISLAPWLGDRTRGGFAVRTIVAAAAHGTVELAVATLEAAAPRIASTAVQGDILRAVSDLKAGGRARTIVTRGRMGATISGTPREATDYSPPLTSGERELLDVLTDLLPDGWTVFVRPHLDGDRPTLALLHRERGAMLWDVRDIDLSDLSGAPGNYRRPDGTPYLDPIDRVNAYRNRLYREYLPGWAEAIDEKPGRFGIVRAGLYFPTGEPNDLRRLGLLRGYEVVIGRGGLARKPISQIVPNATRSVEMRDGWYETLFSRFSEYHPPTFGQIRPTKRQQELINDPPAAGWHGLEGVAGSGKSLVLSRRAARLAASGRRVLLVTYNLTLANYCRALVEDAPERFDRELLVVQHFHGLCHLLLRERNVPPPIHPRRAKKGSTPQDDAEMDEAVDTHFDSRWPTAALDALHRYGRSPTGMFDDILVDEAQDFAPLWFDVLEALSSPSGGRLAAFDRAQRLYARSDAISDRLDMRRVKKLKGTKRLRRRHASIANALGLSQHLPTERIELDDEGPQLLSEGAAGWLVVGDTAGAVAGARTLYERWRAEDGYRGDGAVFLVWSSQVGRALVHLLAEGDTSTNHIFSPNRGDDDRRRKESFVPNDQRPKVATIHSFKGWEADDVIVVEPRGRSLRAVAGLYVALTRTKARLAVLASSDALGLRPQFDSLAMEPNPELVTRARELLERADRTSSSTSADDEPSFWAGPEDTIAHA